MPCPGPGLRRWAAAVEAGASLQIWLPQLFPPPPSPPPPPAGPGGRIRALYIVGGAGVAQSPGGGGRLLSSPLRLGSPAGAWSRQLRPEPASCSQGAREMKEKPQLRPVPAPSTAALPPAGPFALAALSPQRHLSVTQGQGAWAVSLRVSASVITGPTEPPLLSP